MDYFASLQLLKRKLGIDFEFELQAVEQIEFIINKNELKTAIKSHGFDLENTIQLLEIESNIEKVRKEGAISVNMQLGMGLNSSANDLANLYDTPSQSQFFVFQIQSLKEQMILAKSIEDMFTQLLKMGRKTITEYKNNWPNHTT